MTHLYIEQDTGSTEEVNMSIISKLYELASSGNLDNTSDLKGRLHSSAAKKIEYNYLNNNYSDLYILADTLYESFEDPNLENLLKRYIGDSNGVSSADIQQYNLTTFGNTYTNTHTNRNGQFLTSLQEINSITSFNELRLFSNVTELKLGLFKLATSLTSIDMSNIQYINMECFMQSKIPGVINLPNFIMFKGRYGNTDETEQSMAFWGCGKITEVNFGLNFLKFGGTASFGQCGNLLKVTGLSNITTIPAATFLECTSLSSIDVDFSKITSIGGHAFYRDGNLQLSLISAPNLTSLGMNSFRQSGIVSIDNLGTITNIPEACMMNCGNLTSVVLPNTLTTINPDAFRYDNNLQSINIPSSCTSIGGHAFEDCYNLDTTIDLSNASLPGVQTFKNCKKLLISAFPKDSTYGDLNFVYIANTSITIPKEVTTIGNSCFIDCRSLLTLTFESGSLLTSIYGTAFMRCFPLLSVTLPSGLLTIGEQAFRECNSLEYIDIPNTVTSIGTTAFIQAGQYASNPLKVVFRSTTPPFNNDSGNIFGRNSALLSTISIYVPDASIASYKAIPCLSLYRDRIFGISQLPNS